MTDKGIVIVGASHGGVQLAASLREKGYEGPLTMLTSEPDLPYQKPPLSKGYIKEPDPKPTVLRPEKFYTDRDIDLRLGTEATAIDKVAGSFTLADGSSIPCSRIALAVGSRPRRIPVPNIDAPGVLELRTYADSQAIKAAFDASSSVLVIGGGFIGLEIAATAALLGKSVTVLEAEARLMARAVSPAVSAYFLAYLSGLGADIRLNARVAGIRVSGGKASGADLADGSSIEADCVISGTGVVPCTELAEAAGLEIENGISVGETMLSSIPEIAAIGDCASYVHWQLGRRVRLESVQNAVDQAKTAAAALLGEAAPYHEVPWFWSDQGEAKLQIAGLSDGSEEGVLRGDPESGSFSAFLFADGKLRCVESVNKAGDHALARRLIAAAVPLTPEQAADPDCDLRALVKQARR
ncbi:FAD-dependent oxidoreductase [Nisaea acidiphila]|uniref:FAD-dependent oxidoreductase n=1 Tax=Nisaea acidiphila TaxID=1862145 RepID=A0A9J7ATJ1_9PROT|nr:FAD-dependent oxidoreductase [Nisaea acidiphila]UUX50615.1 FAD-dependent oxidoreductase [Nisaea acidiphila]